MTTTKKDLDTQIKLAIKLFKEFAEKEYLNILEEFENHIIVGNEVYIDYRDEEVIYEIAKENSDLTKIELEDKLLEDFIINDGDIDGVEYFEDRFLAEYEEQLDEIFQDTDYEYNLKELFYEHNIDIRNTIDYSKIIDRIQLPVTIYLETEDSFDGEFSNNDFGYSLHMGNNTQEEMLENLEDSSLKVLLESQGYTLEEFVMYYSEDILYPMTNRERYNELNSDKVFLSIYQEVSNAWNNQSLVVLKEMTLDEIDTLNNANNFTVTKDDTIGYFGSVQGDGSVFEIELNNDFTLEKGNFKVIKEGQYGYSVQEVYGLFL